MPNATVVLIGWALREARKGKGWSLNDVAIESDGYFKASCIGAYERGERVIPVSRLVELADFYGLGASAILFGIRP